MTLIRLPAQVALISRALPAKPSANGSTSSMDVDEDAVEDVALRTIDDMGAENQRRYAVLLWPVPVPPGWAAGGRVCTSSTAHRSLCEAQ